MSLSPTSSAQFDAIHAGSLPAPEQIADGVWAIAAPIPGGQIPYTLSYVLNSGDGRIHIIDPWWDSDANVDALSVSLATLGFTLGQLASTMSTHFHPDHLGIAARLRGSVSAQLVVSAIDKEVLDNETAQLPEARAHYDEQLLAWGVPAEKRETLEDSFDRPLLGGVVTPDRALHDGDVIALGSHWLRALATPGHTGGHVCFIDDERKLIYTGDHVLPEIYSGIGIGVLPGSTPLADYLDSLAALAPFAEYQALPGHEYRFEGLESRRVQIAEHHLHRTREVRELVAELGDASIWDFAKRMTWTGGFENLTDFSLHSALRQTQMHRDLVLSGRADAPLG